MRERAEAEGDLVPQASGLQVSDSFVVPFRSIWPRCCCISLQQLNSTLLLLFSLRSRVGGAER